MNILDLVVGKPIKTSDERAEQIGPAQGIPIFGLDALSSAAYGPEAALAILIPAGVLGRSHQRCDHHVAGDRVLFLSPDDCRLPLRWRFLHGGAVQSWRTCQPACRGRSAGRLHSYRSGWHFSGSGCFGLGGSVVVAAHGFAVRGNPDRHYCP